MFDTRLSLETEKEEEKEEEEEERGERWRRQGTAPVSRADPAWPQGWTQDTHAPGGCEDTYPPDGCQNSHAVGRCLGIRDNVVSWFAQWCSLGKLSPQPDSVEVIE